MNQICAGEYTQAGLVSDVPGEANLFADTGWDITADLGGDGMVWQEVLGKVLDGVSNGMERLWEHTDSFHSMGTPVQ